jgi:hypothetical protein
MSDNVRSYRVLVDHMPALPTLRHFSVIQQNFCSIVRQIRIDPARPEWLNLQQDNPSSSW